MSTLKDVLDDAAADAVEGMRVDMVEAAARGDRRRSRQRFWGTTLMLTAAAALLALVVVPALAVTTVRPATGPTEGVPATWYRPPVGTPSVRYWPMAAAALLLRDMSDDGYYVVSAGGKRYARVPLGAQGQLPALSDDGRLLGWLSVDANGAGRLQVLRLADGKEASTAIPTTTFRPVSLRWNSGSFEVTGYGVAAGAGGSADPASERELSCWLAGVLQKPDRLVLPAMLNPATGCGGVPLQAASTAKPSADTLGPYSQVFSPDGRNAFLFGNVGAEPELVVSGPGGNTLVGAHRLSLPTDDANGQPTSPTLLAWSGAGLVTGTWPYSHPTLAGRLTLVDPDTLRQRVLARPGPGAGWTVPVAVVPAAVGDGTAVAAPAPSYPFWRPAEVAATTRGVLDDLPLLAVFLVVVPVLLLGAGIGLTVRSTRRAARARP
ncbi:hypothetical protein ACIB24_04400 [Spongisporangium articulatum]|uniref:WD40-like Beta Propeller Repeat n=1 Tax=Spongisporangium articulatum TaxID=3362603 RepID=A0ABW8AIV3_9ACTN